MERIRLNSNYIRENQVEKVKIVKYIYSIETEINKLVSKDPRFCELNKLIENNNKTFFDPKREFEFIDCTITPGVGEDVVELEYSQEQYNYYNYILNNFDSVIKKYEEEKQKIENQNFVSDKKSKLDLYDQMISKAKNDYAKFTKIKEKEENFKKLWFKDGKFVDLNKDFKDERDFIKRWYTEYVLVKKLDENPSILMFDFTNVNCDKILKEAIKKAQELFDEQYKSKYKSCRPEYAASPDTSYDRYEKGF